MSKFNKVDVDYLEGSVRLVLEPLINDLNKAKPNDPILYMFKWIKMHMGIIYTPEELKLKEELESLRKEVKKYQKKYDKKRDEEEEVSSDEEDLDAEEQARIDELLNINAIKLTSQRSSVSAEAFGRFNQKAEFTPIVIYKSNEQKEVIRKKMLKDFLFNHLDERELNTVIDAFEERKIEANQTIIAQGDINADDVFLVDSGELDCSKKINGIETYLKTYTSGQSFGELALLYNAPRAATIIAKTNCLLWALNRNCFNAIIRNSAVKKRGEYERFLQSVEILQTMNQYEIGQICDAIKVETVPSGIRIISQNEEGNTFYLLEKGEAYATKLINDKEETVLEYKKGSYFGELSLLKDEPRAANVYAKTDCRLLTLDRPTFKRILGPLQVILERNFDAYIKYLNK